MVLGSPSRRLPSILVVMTSASALWFTREANRGHGSRIPIYLLMVACVGIIFYDVLQNYPLLPPNDNAVWGRSFSRSGKSNANQLKLLIGLLIFFLVLGLAIIFIVKPAMR